MSKRLSVALLVVAVVIAGSFAPAQAYIRRIAVQNDTDTCAVVTVFEQRNNGAWVVLGQPRMLQPRTDVDYPTAGGGDKSTTSVRVRAEMKANADCSGATVSDLDQPDRSVLSGVEYSEAVLLGTKGGYRIKF